MEVSSCYQSIAHFLVLFVERFCCKEKFDRGEFLCEGKKFPIEIDGLMAENTSKSTTDLISLLRVYVFLFGHGLDVAAPTATIRTDVHIGKHPF